MRVELILDEAGLLALREPWGRLEEAAGLVHPFLTHDWITAWWQAFGAGRALRILALFSGETCVAIAPLMLGRIRLCGIPARSLELIGNEHTPRAGFLVDERFGGAWAALLAAMLRLRDRWDVLVLPQLPLSSPTLTQLERLAREEGVLFGRRPGPCSPRLALEGDWAGYLGSLRPKQRTNLRNRTHRLEKLGKLELEELCQGPRVAAALEEGLRIEAAAWKGAASTAIDSQARTGRFYRQLAGLAAERGWLSLHFLTVAGERIAFSYGLRFRGTLYLLKQGYEPRFAAASPSQVLCARMIEEALARGDGAVDFLGDGDAWKREWTQSFVEQTWLYLFKPGLRALPLSFAKLELAPFLRRAWDAARKSNQARDTARRGST